MPTSSSTLNAAALATLERAINTALQLDPATHAQVAALDGKIFLIQCTAPELCMHIFPTVDGVLLKGTHEGHVSCAVSGPASEFVILLGARDKASALVNGGLRITGDSAPLLALERALSKLDLDWEARLAVLIGDIPAHQIGRAVRGSARWGRSARETLLRQVEEFVHEEARLAPPRLEVEDFFSDLRKLEQDSERLEARMRRISRRIGALNQGRHNPSSTEEA